MVRWHLRLAAMLAILALGLGGLPAMADGPVSFTLADLGLRDIVVRQCYDLVRVPFPVAEGRQIARATLRLHLAHGKKLLPARSDLTIALNGEPAACIALGPENADARLSEIELPAKALRPGQNELLFRFRLRLREAGRAETDPGLWARVLADSAIGLEGAEAPLAPDLARFPAPFTSLSSLPGNPGLALVLPPQPTPAELTAAARIAAALGQAAAWERPPLKALTLEQLDGAGAAADHLIAVGIGDRNPLAGAVHGLGLQVSPHNPNRLLLAVTGDDGAALLQTADVLAAQAARTVSPRGQPVTGRPARASFAALGLTDRRVRGIGGHDLYYPIDVPYDWRITSAATIELRFRHARGLAGSAMRAYVNGYKVADVPLVGRNADDGLLTVQLSPRQLRLGRNWLHIVYDLHVRREDCSLRYLEQAWAEVTAADSAMNLAHVTSQPPFELRYLPSPLVTPAGLGADLFVLPAEPTPGELTAMVRMAAKLGTYAGAATVSPQATTADRFVPSTADSERVIAIGRPETNALLGRYDAQLPQPLARPEGAPVAAGGRELEPEELAGEAGYLELVPAPWSRDGALVVVSAPADAPLLRAVDALPVMGHRLDLEGNVAIITARRAEGLEIGGFAPAPLSAPARRGLALILLGSFTTIGGVGVWSARRRRPQGQESQDAQD